MELEQIQEQIESYTRRRELHHPVEALMIDLCSEVGELAKEVLKGSDYGHQVFKETGNWKAELGDVFFSLICLANETGADLIDCLKGVLEKYESRFKSKGNLGSGQA